MTRKEQREWIFKLIYQYDLNKMTVEDLNNVLANHELEDFTFIKESVLSIIENIDKIDGIIDEKFTATSINKIFPVDRSILRVSINESWIQKTVPLSVSINEAVELSKLYSNKDNYKFINGILSTIAKDNK